MHHYQTEMADLEIASLPGADDVPVEQNQQSTQPIAEQDQQTDQAVAEQNQQADQEKAEDAGFRTRTIKCHPTEVRQGVETCLLDLRTML